MQADKLRDATWLGSEVYSTPASDLHSTQDLPQRAAHPAAEVSTACHSCRADMGHAFYSCLFSAACSPLSGRPCRSVCLHTLQGPVHLSRAPVLALMQQPACLLQVLTPWT